MRFDVLQEMHPLRNRILKVAIWVISLSISFIFGAVFLHKFYVYADPITRVETVDYPRPQWVLEDFQRANAAAPAGQRSGGAAVVGERCVTVRVVVMSVFWFSDIEGSTRLWASHPDAMGAVLERHDQIVFAAVGEAGGLVFKHTGDGVVARFDSAVAAIGAAVAVRGPWRRRRGDRWVVVRVQIGVHAGEAQERDGDWFGPALNRAAREMAVGHGGQVLVSAAVAELGRHDLMGAG